MVKGRVNWSHNRHRQQDMGTYAESLSLLSSSLLLSGSATGSVIDLLMGAILEAASSDGIITGAFGTVVLSLLLNSFERKGMTRGDCPDEIYSKPLLAPSHAWGTEFWYEVRTQKGPNIKHGKPFGG